MTYAEKFKELTELLATLGKDFDENIKQLQELGDLLKRLEQQEKDAHEQVEKVKVMAAKHVEIGAKLIVMRAQTKCELEQAKSENAQQS